MDPDPSALAPEHIEHIRQGKENENGALKNKRRHPASPRTTEQSCTARALEICQCALIGVNSYLSRKLTRGKSYSEHKMITTFFS